MGNMCRREPAEVGAVNTRYLRADSENLSVINGNIDKKHADKKHADSESSFNDLVIEGAITVLEEDDGDEDTVTGFDSRRPSLAQGSMAAVNNYKIGAKLGEGLYSFIAHFTPFPRIFSNHIHIFSIIMVMVCIIVIKTVKSATLTKP